MSDLALPQILVLEVQTGNVADTSFASLVQALRNIDELIVVGHEGVRGFRSREE